MILCGLSITGFSLSVLADVITRELGMPWLWLQQVTTGFFAWGIFLGIGVATRRNEHLYLAELVNSMTGVARMLFELLSRGVVMVVAAFMIYFGIKNAILDMGSFRMPSLIPLTYYSACIPLSGALIFLFAFEQLVNGLRHGFAEPDAPAVTETGYE
ncbi:MAG: TRAP transporter small permease [Alphaproteobacteria bacterium]|nr:TRAP transporter small permease [Alphaproteobacteria bacterium]